MVKRKRTLSIKENSDSVNQSSDADQINEYPKRLKTHGSPWRPEEDLGGEEAAQCDHSPLGSPTSPSTTQGTVPEKTIVPASISQPLPDVPLPTPPPVVTQTRPTPQLRTSARVLNKQRREEIKADPEYAEEEDALGGGIGKKRRRPWELWSMEDKNIFFESINECGKDFEAIQNYLTTKLRKKGAPCCQIKNKDQVRHFYYRTWHKISKHITFNEGVKKATQELYGLINYGELRKKIGGTLDERKAQKLQELIRKGSTSVRVKGKSVRVRTPICRALKKLNQIEENRENAVLRVPTSITVEVVPASVHAWCRVQGLAHNPRVRVTLPLQRPLATLISHLQEKWRSSNLKLVSFRDTLSSRVTFPLDLQTVNEPVLRLTPAKGYFVKPINVQPEVLLKSSCVSLSSHEARLRRRGEKLGRSSKRKENKQQQEKETEEREGATRDSEGRAGVLGGDAERTDPGGVGDADGKCREVEVLGGELEDFGEVSQEEHEDCSDGEVGCLNSPDGDSDDLIRFSPDKNPNASTIPFITQVKEEPIDSDEVMTSTREDLDPDIKVKEESEGESGDTLRQLLALETVASARVMDDDAEVAAAEEERGLATSPEPEEEERNPGTEPEEGTEQDIEAKLQKIRDGLTINSFGQNKKICLEYEFEDQVSKANEDGQVFNGSSNVLSSERNGVLSPSRMGGVSTSTDHLATKTVSDTSVPDVPGAGMAANLVLEKDRQSQIKKKDSVKVTEAEVDQGGIISDSNLTEKKCSAVENLSGMLAQLMTMTRMILAKSSTDTCLCGHICGRPGNTLRSPTSGRCQGTLGIGRSPGNTRSPRTGKVTVPGGGQSPRTGRLTAAGCLSPGINSPGSLQSVASAGRSPLANKLARERSKPASAKRLIPEHPESSLSLMNGRLGDLSTGTLSGGLEVSFLTPVSSTGTNATTTTSISQDVCGQLPVNVVATGSPTPVTGLRVVLGTGAEAGEFKVPNGRRVVRKNVVVQRQLPLLPKTVIQTPGVVTMKVLQNPTQDKMKTLEVGGSSGFIPITIAPSSHGGGTASGTFNMARTQPLASSTHSSSTHSVRNSFIQSIQSSVNQNVIASPVQLSVVPQLQQTAPPPITPLPSAANAISVNISGQPLLTVEMPTSVPAPPLTTELPNKLVPDLSDVVNSSNTIKISACDTSTLVKNTPSDNSLLSSMVSQVLSELPDLSTPPGTPQPCHSRRSPNGNGMASFVRNLEGGCSSSTSISVSCSQLPSPLHFNSTLSIESIPSLGGSMLNNNSQVTSLPPSLSSSLPPCLSPPSSSPTPCVSSSLSPISTLLTPASTRHLELSPPPSQTNAFTSLLNTPTSQSSRSITSTPVHDRSPTTPSISALLSSPPDLSKSFSNILASSDQGHHPTVTVSTANVPELHIPEGSVGLPLLDISLGGTVTLADHTPDLLRPGCHTGLGVNLVSCAPVTTVTSASAASLSATATMIGVNPVQETSSDKLLDITLGISNSNSSFSSLLAAATQPRCLDSSLLEISSIEGDGCSIGGDNATTIVNGTDVGNVSVVGISGFPALSTTPPSPPSSPSRLLQQSDNQWLNSEVNDFSLSSFLGHFESPVKSSNSRGSSQAAPSGPFMPSLSSVYNENSVDFTATFAEMKAQVSGVFKQ
ncbi:cramped-like [Homarus americanus]|uniref:Cramped-like n=1 Tax=Homarus americanus TaxID=6706 RepID=A0A8J5K2B4_HOMAM|nr:cramped-like [Homarus americanus]